MFLVPFRILFWKEPIFWFLGWILWWRYRKYLVSLLPWCCDLGRKMCMSASSSVKEWHRVGMGSVLSLLTKDRLALIGKLCRFIPSTDDGVWDCSPESNIVYSCGSFSARTSLTAFHNSTMLIAASEYWHKVLLWFFFASFFDLRKEKSTLYWLPVLQQTVRHPSVVTPCNTQTTCKDSALQHLLLLTGQFSSLLCHLSLRKQNQQQMS